MDASPSFFVQESDKFSVVLETHSLRICLQINAAQLCLWQTGHRFPKLEIKNKSDGANDRKHTNWNYLNGQLISADTFYPKPYFSSNQHNHQQAAFADCVGVFSNFIIYSRNTSNTFCVNQAAFLIYVNMSSFLLNVLTSKFYQQQRLLMFLK